MADIQFLRGTATVENGSATVQISGANSAFVSNNTAFFTEEPLRLAEAIKGDGSTITLRHPWPYDSGTFEFQAFGSIEGLANALIKLEALLSDSVNVTTAFNEIITSTEETITIELTTGTIQVTPYGYLELQGTQLIEALQDASDLFDQLETDVQNLTTDVAQQQGIVDANLQASESFKDDAELAAQQAAQSYQDVSQVETNVISIEQNVVQLEQSATDSAGSAVDSATIAQQSAQESSDSASAALTSEQNAADSEQAASGYAQQTESLASDVADDLQEVQAIRVVVGTLRDETRGLSEVAAAWANGYGYWDTLSGSLNVPASVRHNGSYWLLMRDVADVALSEPSASNDDWQPLSEEMSVNWDTIQNKPDTDGIPEGSYNLYFTNARAVAAIKADADWKANEWDEAYSWGNHADAGYANDGDITGLQEQIKKVRVLALAGLQEQNDGDITRLQERINRAHVLAIAGI